MKARIFATLLLATLALPALPPAWAHDDGRTLGKIDFPVSCNEAAGKHFEQGMLLQYNYHWKPARKAFEAAAAADAACGMAHFGLALASMDNILSGAPGPKQLAEGRAAIAKARAAGLATARERALVDAAEAFFRGADAQPGPERMATFEDAMARVHAAFPADAEVAVLYAWAMLGAVSLEDQTYARQRRAAALLEKVSEKHPDHPGVVHFLVHAYDYPALAALGVPAARRYAKLAASAPHALHMPSHIFTRMGYWRDSVETNAAAAKTCDNDRCRLHSFDYMVYAHLQLGEVEHAAKLVERMREYGSSQVEDRFVGAYALASAPLRLALETGRWRDAAAFSLPRQSEAWAKLGPAEMILAFGRGLGAARAGESAQAREEMQRLAQLEAKLAAGGEKYWATQSRVHRMAIEAWVEHAEGRREEALRRMRAAAEAEEATEKHIVTPGPLAPAREMLAEMLLEAGRADEAYRDFVKTLEREPGRRRALLGAAAAAERADRPEDARRHREKVAGGAGMVPATAQAEETDPCPCRMCRRS